MKRSNINIPENKIAYGITGCIYNVYNKLGPGLLENVYEQALSIELRKKGFQVKTQEPINVFYDGIDIGTAFRMDIIVNDLVIIEIKSLEELSLVHHKQLLTYLKITGKRLGLLVNFNTGDLKKNIVRKVNGLPDEYKK